MILPPSFFNRPTLQISQELLGKFLVENISGVTCAHIIVEVEAYDGPDDLASHASKGMTPRNAPMFEQGGIWYVYLVYGMHYMLNIVTGEKNYPAAILIRGIIHEDGRILNGPAKLTKALRIDKIFNGLSANKKFHLWVEDRGVIIPSKDIHIGSRIGVDYAKEWKDKPYRFFLDTKKYAKKNPLRGRFLHPQSPRP